MGARYIKRAVKQFVYFAIFVLIVTLLVYYLSGHNDNLTYADLFAGKNGLRMLFFLLIFAAIYPIFGYSKRVIAITGSLSDHYNNIVSVMKEYGFEPTNDDMRNNALNKEGKEVLKFRHKNGLIRLMRIYEDTVTITDLGDGLIEAEGLRKEIVRVGSAIERAVSPTE